MPTCIPCGFIEKGTGRGVFLVGAFLAFAALSCPGLAGQEPPAGGGGGGLFGPVPDGKPPVKPDAKPPPDLAAPAKPEPPAGTGEGTGTGGVMTLPGLPEPVGNSVTGTTDGRESQFTVECEDRITRNATASFAESLAQDFRRLMAPQGRWHHRIQIRMRGTLSDVLVGAETARQVILGPDGKLVFFLHVRLSERFRKEMLTREILRLLVLDHMLVGREQDPSLGDRTIEEPGWLVSGVAELMRFRSQGRPSETFAGLIKSRQFLPTARILEGVPEGADSITREIWVASSTALVATLLAQPEAVAGFRDYLGDYIDLPVSRSREDDAALLRQHFPALRGSQVSLDKWWALELATMGDRHLLEFLTAAETESALDVALAIRIEPPGSGGGAPKPGALAWVKKWVPGGKRYQEFLKNGYTGRLHDIDGYAGLPGDDKAVEHCLIRLTNLRQNCFPVYRPLMDRYITGAKNLLEGKWQGVAESLATADRERQQTMAILGQVRDVMNFEEATRSALDAEFRDYDAARERLKHLPRLPREDAITKYLDAYEREMRSQ